MREVRLQADTLGQLLATGQDPAEREPAMNARFKCVAWLGPTKRKLFSQVVFSWDNSYSKLTPKTISFHIRVFTTETTGASTTSDDQMAPHFTLDGDHID